MNWNPTSLVQIASSALTTCSSDTPSITAAVSTTSNTRPNFLKIVSNKIQWVNDDGDFKPPVFANAVGHFGLALTVATTTESVTLNVQDFTMTVANIVVCLATQTSLISSTSMTVSADGTNTLNFDPTSLV